MHRYAIVLLLAAMLLARGASADTGLWPFTFGSRGEVTVVQVDQAGSIFAAGSVGVPEQAVLLKITHEGALQWQVTSDLAFFSDVKLDAAGNPVVIGNTARSGTNRGYGIAKYDGATGQTIWKARVVGSPMLSAFRLNLDQNGASYITGNSTSIPGDSVKYDSAGNLLWETVTQSTEPHGAALNASGALYVTGRYVDTQGVSHILLVKYNGTSGAEIWRSIYDSPGATFESPFDIALGADGVPCVVGDVQPFSASAVIVAVAFDPSNGHVKWATNCGFGGAIRVTASPSGGYFVTGTGSVAFVDSSGQRIWLNHMVVEWTNAALDPLGNLCVVGGAETGGANFGLMTAEYDLSGNQLWASTYRGRAVVMGPTVTSVAVASDGGVFVGGSGYFSQSMLVLQYGADGTPIPPTPAPDAAARGLTISQIAIQWADESDNATSFEVDRQTGSGDFDPIATVPVDASGTGQYEYDDSGLAPDTSYTYRVKALAAAGDSAYSNLVSATTLPVAPLAPTGLTVSTPLPPNGRRSLDVSWSSATSGSRATGFILERASGTGSNLQFELVTSLPINQTVYEDLSLSAASQYTYRVRAKNSAGLSPYSETATGTTLPAASGTLSAPVGLNFGKVRLHATKTKELLVKNVARSGALSVTVSGPTGPGFALAGTPTSFSIPPRGKLKIQVKFTPVTGGAANGSLTLNSTDDAHSPLVVSLQGAGR